PCGGAAVDDGALGSVVDAAVGRDAVDGRRFSNRVSVARTVATASGTLSALNSLNQAARWSSVSSWASATTSACSSRVSESFTARKCPMLAGSVGTTLAGDGVGTICGADRGIGAEVEAWAPDCAGDALAVDAF